MTGKIILGLIAFSFLPIWRGGVENSRHNGMSLIKMVGSAMKGMEKTGGEFSRPHVLYGEAVRRAKDAFEERFPT